MTTARDTFLCPSFGARYGRRDERRLRDDLGKLGQETRYLDVRRTDDLRMDHAGGIAGTRWYTAHALRQVCTRLAPGLFDCVLDLSGTQRRSGDDRSEYSSAEAAHLFNTVLAWRGVRLEGCQLVLHVPSGRVDGLVGPRHRPFPLSEAFDQLRRMIHVQAEGHLFLAGSISGRRLTARWVRRRVALSNDTGVVRPGFWFAVNELGDEPPRGSELLYVKGLPGSALGRPICGARFAGGVGDSASRLASLGVALFETAGKAAALAPAIVALTGKSLGIDVDRDLRRARIARLSHWLYRRDVPAKLARRAVESAVYGVDSDMPPWIHSENVFEDITQHSLYKSVLHCAQSLHPVLRERMERAAFAMLATGTP